MVVTVTFARRRASARRSRSASALNTALVMREAVYGYLGNATALMADAGPNLSDVFGLLVAWRPSVLWKRSLSGRFTFGLRGPSILAVLANAVFLLIATGAIGWESIQRFSSPEPIAGITVMVVRPPRNRRQRCHGTAVREWAQGPHKYPWRLSSHGRRRSRFGRGSRLRSADPLDRQAMVGSGHGPGDLLRSSVGMSLSAVPEGVDLGTVRAFLMDRPDVTGIHDLHIWPISTTESAMTCHLIMPAGHPGDDFLMESAQMLQEFHKISHATLQIEVEENNACALAPDTVV